MLTKYDAEIKKETLTSNLHRLLNQIYKLLPFREEGADWEKPLNTIQIELAGLNELLLNSQPVVLKLMSKLEGLFTLTEENQFEKFRSTIFECLNVMNELIADVKDDSHIR